jgi:hypothetical protein
VSQQLQFWTIQNKGENRAEWSDEMDFEQVLCSVNPTHMRAGKRISNLHVELEDGVVEDFVQTQYSEWLIQDHVLQSFREMGLTGFEVKPVNARFKKSAETPPNFWELIVTGWGGTASPKSGIAIDMDKSCATCGLLRYTGATHSDKIIDSDQWDSSDFFMVWPLVKYPFLSAAAAKAILEKSFSGVRLTPAGSLTFSPHVVPGFGPGRLSYYMPEKRSHQLGDPLGIY